MLHLVVSLLLDMFYPILSSPPPFLQSNVVPLSPSASLSYPQISHTSLLQTVFVVELATTAATLYANTTSMSVSSPAVPTPQIDLDNATPSQLLHLAATLGRTDLVISAINSGANVNAQITYPENSTSSSTALHASVRNNHIDVTRALLSIPADLHLKDSTGRNALSYLPNRDDNPDMHAVFISDLCQKSARGDHVALSRAISAGLDPTATDSPDLANTPLHWAASFGAIDCVKILLHTGVPVNTVNKAGNSPLLEAAVGGHASIVRLLIDSGADVTIINARGHTVQTLPKLSEKVRVELGPTFKASTSSIKSKTKFNGSTIITPTAVASEAPMPMGAHDDELGIDYQEQHQKLVPNPRTPSFIPGQSRITLPPPPPHLPQWATALWPTPRRFCESGESFTVPPVLTISAENSCLPVARLLIEWLSECRPLQDAETAVRLVGGGQGGLGEPIAFSAAVFLRIDPYALEAANEAYSICVRDFGIDVIASDPRGLFYASATLVNLFQLSMDRIDDPGAPLSLPTLSLSDWPMLRRRGLYLDISRKRVPTVDTLKRLIAFMARHLKMNQLHLNVSSNFDRLKGQSMLGMYRHEDILELDQWCAQHFVDLIPVIGQSGVKATASAASSTPSSQSTCDVSGEEGEMWFDEFLPLFDTELVNLGNVNDDRTLEVPDFARLRKLLRSFRSRGKKSLLVFGNQLARILGDEKLAPSILPELPARMVMILENSERKMANELEEASLRMRKRGIPFYTCTSSMLEGTITGRLSVSLEQTEQTVRAAVVQGAVGSILKDTSLSQSDSPLIFILQAMIPFGGACWNLSHVVRSKRIGDKGEMGMEVDKILSHLLDTYVFSDGVDKGVLGGITVSLGDLNVIAGDVDGTMLPKLLAQRDKDTVKIVDKLAYMGLRRVVKRADRMEMALQAYDGNAAPEIVAELRMSAVFMGVAARMGAWLLSISSAVSMDTKARDDGETEEDTLFPSFVRVADGGRGSNSRNNGNGNGNGNEQVVMLSTLPDGRRSDLCNTVLQGVELLRETWMTGYQKVGFVEAVDRMVGEALNKLAQDMPYQAYINERRAEEWIPFEE